MIEVGEFLAAHPPRIGGEQDHLRDVPAQFGSARLDSSTARPAGAASDAVSTQDAAPARNVAPAEGFESLEEAGSAESGPSGDAHAVPVFGGTGTGRGMARNVGGGYSGGRRTGGYARHGSWRSRSAGRGGFAGNPGAKTESAHERDGARDADACREAALRLLDAAPRPSGALAERLRGKGYDADVVERVVARLVEVGLVDDEEYARSAIRYCAGRLLGYRGTFAEMTRKGVERSLARRVCDQARDEGVFEECAWELGRRYAAKTQGLEPEVRKRRFWSAGGRKGHDPAILREVAHDCFD